MFGYEDPLEDLQQTHKVGCDAFFYSLTAHLDGFLESFWSPYILYELIKIFVVQCSEQIAADPKPKVVQNAKPVAVVEEAKQIANVTPGCLNI